MHLQTVLSTEEDVMKFAQEKGLLPKSALCPSCEQVLTKYSVSRTKSEVKPFRYRFVCTRRECKDTGRHQVSVMKNSFFEGVHTTMKKCIVLVYLCCYQHSIVDAVRETSGPAFNNQETSRETVVDFYSYCREVCVESLYEKGEFKKIGGLNCTVEIDEAKFGKRKYNRGRVVEGQWVLGGICRESNASFFVPVEDRTAETLVGIIVDRVEKGATIITDCFPSYSKLEDFGYKHLTVNHSENFVDPVTGACTNLIESTWWAIKRSLPSSHTSRENFGAHLAEFMWRRRLKANGANLFTAMLAEIAKVYPGPDA